ncbi:phage integrase SAM-like domain-containing protein [Chryseobacterium oranimense]|uniref:tyrosine-type recombinase/integrase n=1 Tax=Chryseobacterium oranimense TaxID=421058 RepID=UPI0021AE9CA1|nr:phage integrase SAM-like domain-containing protein [Chryseobacterium oranimense]UWX60388.1 phage integrase SAM-like domain-containing protein [Chryseobacterium oranimense]
MATKFFIRVKTGIKSTIYFRYNKGREFEVTLKTPYSINPKNWDDENECYNTSGIKKNPKTPLEKNLITEISLLNNNLALLKSEVSIFLTNNTNASKEDIKDFYNKKYFPEKEKPKPLKTAIPIIFSDFIDYYIKEKSRRIEGKQDPMTEATSKKLTTIKNRIILFDKKLSVKDINDDFRDDLTEWMQREKYSSSTIIKDLKYIKTVCSLASKKKIDINSEVLHWEFMKVKQTYTPPILSLSELKQIQTTIYPHDYLENAKDWIIIGFYTGARVSDLLSFDTSNITDGNILKFSQKKIQNQTNDAEEYIWLHSEVLKVLEKRNNQFPRKISDVKLNLYIKEVCKIAGLTQKMIGGIKNKEQGGRGKKIIKEYEKWELVTTHIFRRSFVTNFIEILGKENIKTQTGHKTDDMVNLYNKTEKLEKARRVGEKMEAALKIS